MNYSISHLKELESEAIYIIRETAAQFENPVLLFSGGKDSILLSYLAKKAFYPAPIPMPLLHIDTGHNFDETIIFRDQWVEKIQAKLYVGNVQLAIDAGRVTEEKGFHKSRNTLQTQVLLDTIAKHGFDAAMGGARRDEEKSRAKERFFSHRNKLGQWDPKNQRPELWNLFNGRKKEGEQFRVFPISNWTELDVWNYLLAENVPLPSLYFSHERACFTRDGIIYAATEFIEQKDIERTTKMNVRYRTIGDMTCTGAVLSNANTIEEVVAEIALARVGERGARSDDKRSDSALEDRKRSGYF